MSQSTFMNFVSEKLIHANKTVDANGVEKAFYNVSIPCAKSKTGFGSIAVNAGQVLTATRKDGSAIEGLKNILLGKADAEKSMSIATNKKGDKFKTVKMTNAEIASLYADSRKEYRAAQAVAVAADAE